MAELRVQSGAIIAQRFFDICYSIDLAAVELLWLQRVGGATSRIRLTRTPTKAVAFDVPPVLLNLGPLNLKLGTRNITAAITARLYDFGVVAFAMEVPAEGLAWEEFTGLVNGVDAFVGPGSGTDIWNTLLGRIKDVLTPAMTKPGDSHLQEDYLLAEVRQWSEPVTGAKIPDLVDLVPLLSGETRQLSEGAKNDLMRQRFSYHVDDLAIITWDRAFIVEPRGDSDVRDILEVANAQLLELRYYDKLLDEELPRMYALVESTRRHSFLRSPRSFANLARNLHALVAEITELTERVDNALQVTGDVYLARIYTSALDMFRVPGVGAAVDKKLAIIRDTYAALFNEASGSRGEMLEAAIILLILLEIAIALSRHAG
jgi:hypothetical protein